MILFFSFLPFNFYGIYLLYSFLFYTIEFNVDSQIWSCNNEYCILQQRTGADRSTPRCAVTELARPDIDTHNFTPALASSTQPTTPHVNAQCYPDAATLKHSRKYPSTTIPGHDVKLGESTPSFPRAPTLEQCSPVSALQPSHSSLTAVTRQSSSRTRSITRLVTFIHLRVTVCPDY